MSRPSNAVVTIPAAVARGEVFEIRALVRHEMESGFRHTEQGVRVLRDIIQEFICTYNGAEVFRATLHPGISANPLLIFHCRADRSGELVLRWTGDNNYQAVSRHAIVVT